MIRSRYINGNIVYYDTHMMRLVDAIGVNVQKWELRSSDLQATAATGTDPRGYTTTMVEAGAGSSEVEASDELGFVAEFVTDTFDNDGINLQVIGRSFRCAGQRHVYFGIALQADEATQSDFFVGLAVPTTDALAGVTDSLSFRKLDAATAISAVTEKDSIETTAASVGTLAANTTVTLELYFDGLSVYYYVNGVQVARHTTNIPDDETLAPIMQFLSGSAGAKRFKVLWARALQVGP